jgi:hypothetical protein
MVLINSSKQRLPKIPTALHPAQNPHRNGGSQLVRFACTQPASQPAHKELFLRYFPELLRIKSQPTLKKSVRPLRAVCPQPIQFALW